MDRRVWMIAGIVLIFGLGFITYQQFTAPPIMNGSVISPTKIAPDFTLDSDHGEIRLSDLRGKLVLLYFGYTYCPDVCPTTMLTLKQAVAESGLDANELQVIFITVDPGRDTAERVGTYARYFNPSFEGLSGSQDQIARVADDYQIHFHYNDSESSTNYTVDHTSYILVIDRQGNQRLIWPHGMEADKIASDLKALVNE